MEELKSQGFKTTQSVWSGIPTLERGNDDFFKGDGFIPYAAPSTGAFAEISPQGSGRDAARFRRGRKPLPKTLGKIEERRE